jgi:1-aminocyclopropane-1-carboxylate deaminase
MTLANSAVTKISVFGRSWYIKRDDLLDESLSGNKARKLYRFAANPINAKRIVSYGGAQSNAMYSLSALAKIQGVEFVYYAKTLPKTLRDEPSGNLRAALSNGMRLVELPHAQYESKITELLGIADGETLLIRQGGADEYARDGLKMLSSELVEYAADHNLQNPIAVTSSGTGTSAGYLADYLPFECLTVPCVADGAFLDAEFERLGVSKKPTVLETTDKIAFATPHPKLLAIYRELLDTGIEFDLIYDAKCWLAVVENMDYFEGRDVIFVHSGGTLGNETQLERYKYKGLA